MKRIHLILLVKSIFLLSTQIIQAEIKLPAIVSSNMVLQRNTTVVLWGWADAKEKISIEPSWLDETFNVESDNDGKWRIEVKTTNSLEPQTIYLKSITSNIFLENILFGEVWLCSGQSNMLHSLKGHRGEPTFGALETIAKSRNPNLRFFTADQVGSKTPLDNLERYKTWHQADPSDVGDFSAVAYFYGSQLQEILGVPVGLIHTSWGASTVQAWMSKEVLSKYQKVDLENVDLAKNTRQTPTALFNAMINPLTKYTIKGVLWYQGESNRSEPQEYKELFPAMVENWRKVWGIGDFPFYYVQIAPYWYKDLNAFESVSNSAFIREVQLQCTDLIPKSGIVITMDIGAKYSIHPPKKKEVADRLLYLALNQTYGYEAVDYAGPTYSSLQINEDEILLNFNNADNGLFAFGELDGFEIAGEDRVFYNAQAEIYDKQKVLVKSDSVSNPKAVRYGWRNWLDGKLYNTNLLPASSFRTDNWDNATKYRE